MHPNLPPNQRLLTSPFLRLLLSFYALMAPEAILYWAAVQRTAAQHYANIFQKKKWTTTHGFFLIMGGFTIPYEETSTSTFYRTLGAEEFVYLAENNLIEFPVIEEADLIDKSKGDPLAKCFAIMQTLWFAIQILARFAQKLVITELELVTLALVPLNVATYYCWMYKPLSVKRAIPLRWKLEPAGMPTMDVMHEYLRAAGIAGGSNQNIPVPDPAPAGTVDHTELPQSQIINDGTVEPPATTGNTPGETHALVGAVATSAHDNTAHSSVTSAPGFFMKLVLKLLMPGKTTRFLERLGSLVNALFHQIQKLWNPEPDQIDKPLPSDFSLPDSSNIPESHDEPNIMTSNLSDSHDEPNTSNIPESHDEPNIMTSNLSDSHDDPNTSPAWLVTIQALCFLLLGVGVVVPLSAAFVAIAFAIYLALGGLVVALVVPFLVLSIPIIGALVFGDIGNEPDTLSEGNSRKLPMLYAPSAGQHEITLMFAVTGATVFGGLHVIGWNFDFPSLTERTLWRISSSMLTTLPVVYLNFNNCKGWSSLRDMTYVMFRIIILTCIPLYVSARLYVLVESVVALRDPVPGTFSAVVWSKFIPHI